MVDEHKERELERQLAELPVPHAREAFQSALRDRFLEETERGSQSKDRVRRPSGHWRWVAAATTLAGTLCVVLWLATRERPSRWVLLGVDAPAGVQVDGRELESRSVSALARALNGAGIVATGAAPLRCELDETLRVELGEQSELALLSVPESGAAGEILLDLRSGALRIITLGVLEPRRLRVLAADAETVAVGTEFAIDVYPGIATCICCTEGAIEVTPTHGEPTVHRVEAGGMAWCPADGSAPMTGSVKPAHVAPLDGLRDLRSD